jgi:hypothetical protein
LQNIQVEDQRIGYHANQAPIQENFYKKLLTKASLEVFHLEELLSLDVQEEKIYLSLWEIHFFNIWNHNIFFVQLI